MTATWPSGNRGTGEGPRVSPAGEPQAWSGRPWSPSRVWRVPAVTVLKNGQSASQHFFIGKGEVMVNELFMGHKFKKAASLRLGKIRTFN